MTSTNFITTVLTVGFLILCLSPFDNPVHADARGDAQNQCVQSLGQGAVAEEELDFGEVSYVCNCASPSKWNSGNTRCVSNSAQSDSLAIPDKPAPSVPKADTQNTNSEPKFSPSEMVRKGSRARDEKRYATALLWYRRAAEENNRDGMFWLANLYRLGNGVTKNSRTAFNWYLKSANLGDPYAMSTVGNFYARGEGVKRNYRKAVQYYLKAQAKGYNGDAYGLALLYEDGKGVKRSRQRAAQFMTSALKNGSKTALNEMTTNANAWSKQFRRELQKIMRSKGAYAGRIDGAFGPGTKRAIRKLAGK